VGAVLIASIFHVLLSEGRLSMHELLITLFLFLSAPVTCFFLAQAYLARKVPPEKLPGTGCDHGWSVYDDPPGRP
jgi:multicomponent K+:H+ antiporter subunit G